MLMLSGRFGFGERFTVHHETRVDGRIAKEKHAAACLLQIKSQLLLLLRFSKESVGFIRRLACVFGGWLCVACNGCHPYALLTHSSLQLGIVETGDRSSELGYNLVYRWIVENDACTNQEGSPRWSEVSKEKPSPRQE
jgi:hypothetical protein